MVRKQLDRVATRCALACGIVAMLPTLLGAQGELVTFGFQSAPPYTMDWPGGSRALIINGSHQGPKQLGRLWNFTHFASGGFLGRPFTRYNWWDWDVSQVGHGSEVAGWTEGGSRFRPAAGWAQFGQGPFYLRLRMRVNSPIVPHASTGGCDGDTQMKFFHWNNFTGGGTDRVMLMFHDGAFGPGWMGTGNVSTQTTVQLRAGVSGSWSATRIPNGQWVHLQVGWRWGPESTGYQRIWVNNNNLNSPNHSNNAFNDLPNETWGPLGGPTGLDSQFFLGDIANNGSCVSEDAAIDLMDVELATQFAPDWYPGASSVPTAPQNVRIVPGLMASARDGLMPFAVLGVMLGLRGMRRREK